MMVRACYDWAGREQRQFAGGGRRYIRVETLEEVLDDSNSNKNGYGEMK